MIQSNANVRFSIKFESLGFRVIKGPISARLSIKSIAAREVERPPFYSDVKIDEVFIIEKLTPGLVVGRMIGGMRVNERVVD